jgi:MFS family permease
MMPPLSPSVEAVQRRTLMVLVVAQVAAGVGMIVGSSVGALLAAEMVGVGVAGLAQSAAVLGSAVMTIPALRIVNRFGRGPSLAALYLVAAAGAGAVLVAAMTGAVLLLFLGYFLFGAGTAAGFQARYAAVDLAPPDRFGRHLSLVVWATTIGAVIGPNVAAFAARTLGSSRVPPLAAPFGLSAMICVAVAAILILGLRPDPLLLARGATGVPSTGAGPVSHGPGMRVAFREVLERPPARLGLAATVIGHMVMVGLMSMTPVHIRAEGLGPSETLRIVGWVISLHVAGMYAFAPIFGWLSDRWGRERVILGGLLLLVAASAISGSAGHDPVRLGIGLLVLGLGWSATTVAGSALLTRSIPAELRPAAQGMSDLVMGLAAALSGGLAGAVMAYGGYPILAISVACLTIPFLGLTGRTSRNSYERSA